MTRFPKIAALLLFAVTIQVEAQTNSSNASVSYSSLMQQQGSLRPSLSDSSSLNPHFPDPHQVLYKSLIIPGWGQVVNHQVWKVPIVYALLGGLTGYSIYLTKRYHDYRAAFFNLNPNTKNKDQRFGSTPPRLQNANISNLRSTRDKLHNRRDFIYVTIALAYGLNAVDAYVFANLRPFDVSGDLSIRASVKPHISAFSSPGFTLSFQLFNKNR